MSRGAAIGTADAETGLTMMMPASECTPQALVAGALVRMALAVPLPADPYEPADVPLAHRKLTVNATGGRVVYLVGRYLPETDQYEIQWPD